MEKIYIVVYADIKDPDDYKYAYYVTDPTDAINLCNKLNSTSGEWHEYEVIVRDLTTLDSFMKLKEEEDNRECKISILERKLKEYENLVNDLKKRLIFRKKICRI